MSSPEKMPERSNNSVYKLLLIASNVEGHEVRGLVGSFLFVVVLMSDLFNKEQAGCLALSLQELVWAGLSAPQYPHLRRPL